MRRITYLLLGLIIPLSTFAQSAAEVTFTETDSTATEPVIFTTSSASAYIIDLLETDHFWRPAGDTIKRSLARLIDHFTEPFDSVEKRLSSFNYNAIKLEQVDIVRNDTLPLRWLNDSTFMIDTVALKNEPVIIEKKVINEVIYRSAIDSADDLTHIETLTDSLERDPDILLRDRDTVVLARDTLTA
ncbi:MAG: hypothetical protein KAI95_14065, partial [Bacteroidales bacterium]|nr:hypothetical protein [Bacteroidales bacterium]